MKRSSKFLSLLLSLAMIISLFVPAMAAEVTPYSVPADVSGKLVIIHTNDTHGRDVAAASKTIGTAGVVALKKDFEAAGAKVLLLSAGDFSQGTTLVGLDQGASAVDFMNAAGYDVATLGNHEFDFKMDALRANVKKAEFPILGSNLVDAATKKPLFGDRVTFDTPAGKVGIFGMVTPETMTKAHPDNVKGLMIYQGDAMYADAQAQVNALKADGCKYIIALGHLGVSEESVPNRSTDLLAKVTGIDLFIDGHSHTQIPGGQKVGSTLLVSTGEYLNNVGVVVVDGANTAARLISAAEYGKVDAKVDAIINARAAAVKEEMSKTFGSTEVLLNGARDPGNRTEETNLGDFAADAILWSARGNVGEDKVDAALTNGGGIRDSIKAGEITMNHMKTVFPFGNEVITIDVTGAQLLEALEAATWSTPTAIGAFPQVSGINFTVRTAVPYVNGEQYPNSTYYAPKNPGARVTIHSVNGKTFDLGATYTIATNDFTAAGGDTYYVFKAATNRTMTSVPLEDALIKYTKEVLGGTITAAKYGKAAGRITVNNLPLDVKGNEWFVDAVGYALKAKAMTGTGAGYFAPSGTVTRATVFQTLYNMAGAPQDELKTSFTDVSGKWYAKSAAWAESVGLAAVPANGLFNGDRAITRAEIATIIARYSVNRQVPEGNGTMKNAPDYAAIPAWALDGMTWSYYSKVITGKSGGLLDPSGNALRSELAQILLNLSKVPVVYTEKKVAIEVPEQDGVPAHTVVGILTMPTAAKKDAKVPAVVMLHGTGSNKDEAGGGYAIAAPAMAMNGLASLRIDFMGTAPDKAADYKHYSYTSANIDAKAAADYLAKLENVDGTKLGVMGWSQGGTNALLAAAKYPETFKSVVTWAGALDLKGLAGADFNKAYETAKKDGSYTLKLDWRNPSELPMGAKWFEDVKSTDVLAQVAKIKAPILAINGANDDVVVPENAEKILAASTHADSDAYIVDNCDHTFNVFSGDYSALTEAITATALHFMDSFGLLTETLAPAA